MSKPAEPLYPSLPVCFVAIPFIWNFFTLMGGLLVGKLTGWKDSSPLVCGLLGATAYLVVIFYLPSRRHYDVAVFFSAGRVSAGGLRSVLCSTIGVVLAFASVFALATLMLAACGYDFRSPPAEYEVWDSHWSDWLLMVLVIPFTDELLLRVIGLRGLLRYYSPWVAVLLSASIFVLARWFMMAPLAIFLLGLFLGWLFIRSRSLWAVSMASSIAYLIDFGLKLLRWNMGTEDYLVQAGLNGAFGLPALGLLLFGLAAGLLGYVGWGEVCRYFPSPADDGPETGLQSEPVEADCFTPKSAN